MVTVNRIILEEEDETDFDWSMTKKKSHKAEKRIIPTIQTPQNQNQNQGHVSIP